MSADQSVEPSRPSSPSGTAGQPADAPGELVPMSFPGARRVAGWLFWVVFPALCLAAIAMAVFNIVGHIGDRPTGIRGSFVVSPRTCGQGICSFGGLFSSDDGSITNLPLLGDPRWHSQDVHHVVYDPGSVEVTALPGHWDPTPSAIAALGGVTYLVLVGSVVRNSRRDREH
jgi:hypothetical protein